MTSRHLLMIPGPVELDPHVTATLAHKTRGHLEASFISDFGEVLDLLPKTAGAENAFPFVVAGSGTLAMEMACANLVEPGDACLVVVTGWFGDRMADMLSRLGADVTKLTAPLGDAPSAEALEAALQQRRYKLVTLTHVDTSTGVKLNVETFAQIARKHEALVVVDAVCSLGGERLEQDAWGIDIVLSGSQKALGGPPGLAVVLASEKALATYRARKKPVVSLYVDFGEWLPIMQAYRDRKPSYFATPATNLISALCTSLRDLVREGRANRAERHERLARKFQRGVEALGLHLLPVRAELYASTLTAIAYPSGVGAELVGKMLHEGIVVAGGLHPDIKTRYFRVGHMGSVTESDLIAVLRAVAVSLRELGHRCDVGAAMNAFASA